MSYYADDTVTVHHGDCIDILATLPDASVDAVVTDPPYGLEFMGKEWDTLSGQHWRKDRQPDNTGRGSWFGDNHDSPRYGGKPHEQQAWHYAWAVECLRVLKPGGHLLAFGGTRTSHRLACAIEDAGFEIRDSIAWLYGSGFPKSRDVAKDIDKAARGVPQGGADPTSPNHGKFRTTKTEGKRWEGDSGQSYGAGGSRFLADTASERTTALDTNSTPAPTAAAAASAPVSTLDATATEWQGWGTALKPAHEPVVVARKPLIGTVAGNVLAHGTGALNIDGCRVGDGAGVVTFDRAPRAADGSVYDLGTVTGARPSGAGRWPANVVLDESQAAALDQMSGELSSGSRAAGRYGLMGYMGADAADMPAVNGDTGGASRFFYCAREDTPCGDSDENPATPTSGSTAGGPSAVGESSAAEPAPNGTSTRFFYTAKADAAERVRIDGTSHPTVKPLALMRWLVRLVTPPGGTVLEPFAGSGTTVEACILEGFRCVAIEREADYLPLIVQRIHRRRDPVAAVLATTEDGGLFDLLGENPNE